MEENFPLCWDLSRVTPQGSFIAEKETYSILPDMSPLQLKKQL